MPDLTKQPVQQADLRIGDAERERAAAALNAHVGAGRLDLAEFERRVDAVYSARTRAELQLTLADLPAPAPARRPAVDRRRVVRAAIWGPYLAVAMISLLVWVATSIGAGHPLYFWPIWVIGPWGIALAMGTATGRRSCRPASARAR